MTTGGDSFLESIIPRPATAPRFLTDLSGKIALVTGGSRGIGRAIAIRLAQAGAKIAFSYRGNHDAAQLVLALRGQPRQPPSQADGTSEWPVRIARWRSAHRCHECARGPAT